MIENNEIEMDSRECEEMDFTAFALQDADASETLEFYRTGNGYATLSGVSGRDDWEGDLSDVSGYSWEN